MNTPETDPGSHENKKTWFAIICRTQGDFRNPEQYEELHRVQINGGPMRHLYHLCLARPHALEYHLAEGINAGVSAASAAVCNGTTRPKSLGLHLGRAELELLRKVARKMDGVTVEDLATEILREAVLTLATDEEARQRMQVAASRRASRKREISSAICQIAGEPKAEQPAQGQLQEGAAQ